MVQVKQKGGKAWRVCLVAIFGGIALALVQNKVPPVISVLMDAFSINMSTAGLLSTIFTFVGIIMALPAAMILKRFGSKMSGFAALFFAILGSIVGLMTDNVTVLIISRIIEGTGIGIIAVLSPALITMWFPPEKRGLPMGLWVSWMTISQTVLFFSSTPLVGSFGWQGMWGLGLVACVVAAVLFLLFVQSPPADQSYADVENDDVSIKEGLKSKASFMVALGGACFAFCSFSFVSWVSFYWDITTLWSSEEIANWISVLYLTEMVLAWLVGAALNKIKNRRFVGIIGFIIYGLLGLAAFTISGEALTLIFVFVFPVFDALVPCTVWILAPETASKPIYAGIALGILNIGLNLGTLLSAPVAGALIESFGWAAAGIAMLVSGFLGAVALGMTKFAPQEATEASDAVPVMTAKPAAQDLTK